MINIILIIILLLLLFTLVNYASIYLSLSLIWCIFCEICLFVPSPNVYTRARTQHTQVNGVCPTCVTYSLQWLKINIYIVRQTSVLHTFVYIYRKRRFVSLFGWTRRIYKQKGKKSTTVTYRLHTHIYSLWVPMLPLSFVSWRASFCNQVVDHSLYDLIATSHP